MRSFSNKEVVFAITRRAELRRVALLWLISIYYCDKTFLLVFS